MIEIEKLANMLKCAGIPFERDDDPAQHAAVLQNAAH